VDGNVPVLEWLDTLPAKPEADLLKNGIYELRIGREGSNYRILYFFQGRIGAIVAHGLRKEREVPEKEIRLALERKRLFEQDPDAHTFIEKCLEK
jgi:phage-related protein